MNAIINITSVLLPIFIWVVVPLVFRGWLNVFAYWNRSEVNNDLLKEFDKRVYFYVEKRDRFYRTTSRPSLLIFFLVIYSFVGLMFWLVCEKLGSSMFLDSTLPSHILMFYFGCIAFFVVPRYILDLKKSLKFNFKTGEAKRINKLEKEIAKLKEANNDSSQ